LASPMKRDSSLCEVGGGNDMMADTCSESMDIPSGDIV
jgi:hypothetical protein